MAPLASTEAEVLSFRGVYATPSCEVILIHPSSGLMDPSFSVDDWKSDPDEIE